MNLIKLLSLISLLFGFSFSQAVEIKIELGQTQIHSNYFQVPETGTRVSFPDGREQMGGRLYATWDLNETDSIRLLYAPFTAEATVVPDANISFMNENFAAGTPVDISYTFNSYRLSYIRTWGIGSNYRPHLGFTAKIRDAAIKLSNGLVSKERDNVGFVPLLNLGFDYTLATSWDLVFDIDLAAASQGRAIDGSLETVYTGFEGWRYGLGLRVLDGGVDTDSNVNFAQLRTLFFSIRTHF